MGIFHKEVFLIAWFLIYNHFMCYISCSPVSHSNILLQRCKLSSAGCEKEPSSYMWIYILLGNMLRGIGETPITPLGISYLDDFAKEENVPVYVGNLNMK